MLRRQYRFLVKGAAAYDAGYHEEAIRLAGHIRVLVHDGKWPSLLTVLGLRERLRYKDTANYPDELPNATFVVGGGNGLVMVRQAFGGPDGVHMDFLAPLDFAVPFRENADAPFAQWWTRPCIPIDQGAMSRSELVLAVANTDGHAHLDAKIDVDYARLRDEPVSALFSPSASGFPAPDGLVFASVRQIAFELQRTLEGQIPDLSRRRLTFRAPAVGKSRATTAPMRTF